MNTLVLIQKPKGPDPVKDTITNPAGLLVKETMEVYSDGSAAANAALGGPGAGALGVAYADRIKGKIIRFGDRCLADEAKQPPARQHDVVEFQIVIMFHQTSALMAHTITRALWSVWPDPEWRNLPYKHVRALRVARCFLLSCESAADRVATDGRLIKYIEQALNMRCAAAMGLMSEKTPPPSVPKEFWHPYIFTFSTGDIVTGGLKLHPNATAFVKTPDWEIGPGNEIRPRPGGNKDLEVPAAGKMYIYDGLDYKSDADVPAGTTVDLLRSTLPSPPL